MSTIARLPSVLPRPRSWLGRPRNETLRRRLPTQGGPADLRVRRPRDVAACARLLHVVFYADQYPDVWPESPRAWLTEGVHEAWVAERHGQVLGHVAITAVGADPLSAARWREITGRDPRELTGVSRFFVRPTARGLGIGSGLLDLATARIQERGEVPVLETVSRERDGVALLRERGWQLLAMDPRDRGRTAWQVYRYAAPRQHR